MNRAERRRAIAMERPLKLPPARADGRPLYFDIGAHDQVTCFFCNKAGIAGVRYGEGRAVMNDPANPPEGRPQGEMHTICVHHLPDNAVIYNPRTNYCRSKSGDATWEEGNREDVRQELRDAGEEQLRRADQEFFRATGKTPAQEAHDSMVCLAIVFVLGVILYAMAGIAFLLWVLEKLLNGNLG